MTGLQDSGVERAVEKAVGRFDRTLFEIGDTAVTVVTLITVVVVLAISVLLARVVSMVFGRLLRRQGKVGEGEIRALMRVVRYAIWFAGTAIAISTAGIDLTALFAAGAVFAVAVGFAMQHIVQNFVAGVILLLERAIKPGDVLEVEGQMVKVVAMGIRTTVARTLNDEDLIIPNNTLAQSSVRNFTLRDPEYRLRVTVGVAYSSDMEAVHRVLDRVAREQSWRLETFEPRILLHQFGSSSVDWEVSVWIDDPWRVRNLRSELQRAIWRAFQEAKITIAFPQLDVHFDAPPESAIRRKPDPVEPADRD
ncbi:MAG: mechanosensitive ion channel [Thermoanaerobaculia bacterium]